MLNRDRDLERRGTGWRCRHCALQQRRRHRSRPAERHRRTGRNERDVHGIHAGLRRWDGDCFRRARWRESSGCIHRDHDVRHGRYQERRLRSQEATIARRGYQHCFHGGALGLRDCVRSFHRHVDPLRRNQASRRVHLAGEFPAHHGPEQFVWLGDTRCNVEVGGPTLSARTGALGVIRGFSG